MTTTFYIDANRNNSTVKSDEYKNKWTYKLSNAVQIPSGSEIAVQDCFINKKGISGQTIEILEDIEEKIYFSYYLTDNPHWTPLPNNNAPYGKAYTDAFVPFGLVDHTNGDTFTLTNFLNGTDSETGQQYMYSQHIMNQRSDLFRRFDRNGNQTHHSSQTFVDINDPYNVGYSEQPMMAVRVSNIETMNPAHYNPTGGGQFEDYPFEPLIGNVSITVPKGVYSVNEIADLIEGQINGKYVDIKDGDYYTDTYTKRKNDGVYEGTLAIFNDDYRDSIYRLTDAWDLYGNPQSRASYIGSPSNYPYQFSTLTGAGGGNIRQPLPNPDGMGRAPNKNSINSQAKPTNNVGAETVPNNDMICFIPLYRYRQLMARWYYTPVGYKWFRSRDNLKNSVDFTFDDGGVDVDATNPQTYNWAEKNFNWGVQTNITNERGGLIVPNQFDLKVGTPNNMSFSPIGLHLYRKTNNCPDYYHAATSAVPQVMLTTPERVNQDNNRDGSYLGTSDFQFTYSADASAFSISNLHQNVRVPSMDMWGNNNENEGESVTYMKRCGGRFIRDRMIKNNANITDDLYAKIKVRIQSALQASMSRIGGVAVYNWAYNTCMTKGDVDFDTYDIQINRTQSNVSTYNTGSRPYQPKSVVNNPQVFPEPLSNYQGLQYKDFFSSEDRARDAWEGTLWAKLGFTYDNLQNDNLFEKTKYYDKPNSDLNVGGPAQLDLEGLIEKDFTMYGKTTDSQLDPSVAPTISNTVKAANFAYQQPPTDLKHPAKPAPAQITRTYDNNDVYAPYLPYGSIVGCEGTVDINGQGGQLDGTGGGETYQNYQGSFYRNVAMYPVLTKSSPINATSLPKLSPHGYYLITSDIIDNFSDEVKQQQPLPLLGVVPISNLSNQDFIMSKNTIIHTTQQPKILNQISIEILNPDLTSPILEDGSSVVFQVTMPLPTQLTNQPDMTPQSRAEYEKPDEDKKQASKQPDPRT